MPTRHRPSCTSLAAFFLIASPLLYVLSYAPYFRIRYGADIPWQSGSTVQFNPDLEFGTPPGFYTPVGWLIDNTSLREPLFAWAGVWGVRDEFEISAYLREHGQPTREEALSAQRANNAALREDLRASDSDRT